MAYLSKYHPYNKLFIWFLITLSLSISAQSSPDTVLSRLDTLITKARGYDFESPRQDIIKLEMFIRDCRGKKDLVNKIERRFITELQIAQSRGWQDFICRQLRIIGTEASLDVLCQYLRDPITTDMARFALEGIPGAGVDQRLCEMVTSVPVRTQIGIVTTLGARSNPQSQPVLEKMALDPNAALARAAISAIGPLGTESALQALDRLQDHVDKSLQADVLHAMIQCAAGLSSHNPSLAIKVLKGIYTSDHDITIRIAVLREWIPIDTANAVSLMFMTLNSREPALQKQVIPLIRLLEPDEITDIAGRLSQLSDEAKIWLLTALSEYNGSVPLSPIKAAVDSVNEDVKITALTALGRKGDASCVGILASVAAQAGGEVKKTARDSLYYLKGVYINQAIINNLNRASVKEQAELIRAIGQRRMASEDLLLLHYARSKNSRLYKEAILSLALVGRPEHLPPLVHLLVEKPDRILEDTIVGIACQGSGSKQWIQPVLDAVKKTESVASRAALLCVLGRVGDPQGLDILKHYIQQDADPHLQTEAIRALTQWPDTSVSPDLLGIARTTSDLKHHVLALRAYILMVPKRQPSRIVGVHHLQQALSLARRPEEKKMIFGVLPQMACIEALEMAEQALTQTTLRPEADIAVVKICDIIKQKQKERVKTALYKVITTSESEAVMKDAKQLMSSLDY